MHILFDLDGTLTDSKPGIVRSIEYALDKLGVDIPEESELTRYVGPPLRDTFEKLLENPTTEMIDNAIEIYRERFATVGLFENSVYDGIFEALDALTNQGLRLHIATSKPRVFAIAIAKHFDFERYFDSIHGSELNGTRQDKSELISYLLHQEKIQPDNALMIGDRSHDITGGLNNRLKTTGVLWGYGSRDELIEAGAHRLIARPLELPGIL